MKTTKRIALITTWYPPQQSVATNRMQAFVEYLSENDEVHVFCLGSESTNHSNKEGVEVHYSPSSSLFEWLKDHQTDAAFIHKIKVGVRIILSKFIKNPLKKWQFSTLDKLIKCHRERQFDVVISSFSPKEAHLIAIDFCKQYPTVPWIADMRDEMSKNPYIDANTRIHLQEIEKDVNQYARAIVSVSEPIVNDFKKLCPNVTHFSEIRNGYNHAFEREITEDNRNEVFTFGYFGSFYGQRKPIYFFEALKQLCSEIHDFDFKFEIVGAHQNFAIPEQFKLKVNIHPVLPYNEAIVLMAKMDLNVQLHPKSEQKGVFTGKLFDYISVQKPVLALVDSEDVAAQLIRDFDCGYIAEFDSVEQIKSAIIAAYSDWKLNHIRFASKENVLSLHRKKQVEKLRELMETILIK